MTGHALGRLAFAVQGQPERRAAFDCVQLALEQIIAFKELRTPEEQGQLFRIMMQAGYGMYDREVERLLKGDLPTEPLYDVLGGKIKTPTPSKGPGGAGGGTTPSTTLKDPAVDPVAVAGRSPSSGSSSGGKVAGAGSSAGHCSNWMSMNFSDSKGNLDPGDTGKACALTGKSGDFITRVNPVTKACSICSRDDWTPPSPPPPPIPTTADGGTGGTADVGGVGPDGGSSGKIKCLLYSGYPFSSKADAEFHVLQAKKPDKKGYIEFLYTVAAPSKRFNHIERARKEAKRILKEGTRGKKYGLAFRGNLNGFCSFIESQCDMKISSVNLAAKGCKWEK
ncbi:MAG: hypothetical protein NPINA01_10150 [Nitrospinaceae bacterium]|nr:MAG: hypothetical protein NPINA01_10150 [Nitrospinaceae bacterium]